MCNVSSVANISSTAANPDLRAAEQTLGRLNDRFTALARQNASVSGWWDDGKRDFQTDVMRAYQWIDRCKASSGQDAADIRAGVIALVRELERNFSAIDVKA
ncbi:MAG: hypothetical protein JST30_09225 [Armatimonadetes bacterium]|nr:hypothetical protein [Armatimonadota bacterium]